MLFDKIGTSFAHAVPFAAHTAGVTLVELCHLSPAARDLVLRETYADAATVAKAEYVTIDGGMVVANCFLLD